MADRWEQTANRTKHAGSHMPPADHGVRRFIDKTGASIVEHAGGRFRLCPWTHQWAAHDGD